MTDDHASFDPPRRPQIAAPSVPLEGSLPFPSSDARTGTSASGARQGPNRRLALLLAVAVLASAAVAAFYAHTAISWRTEARELTAELNSTRSRLDEANRRSRSSAEAKAKATDDATLADQLAAAQREQAEQSAKHARDFADLVNRQTAVNIELTGCINERGNVITALVNLYQQSRTNPEASDASYDQAVASMQAADRTCDKARASQSALIAYMNGLR